MYTHVEAQPQPVAAIRREHREALLRGIAHTQRALTTETDCENSAHTGQRQRSAGVSESAAFASLRHSLRALSHSLSLALTPLVDNALVEKLLAIYTHTVAHTATHTTTHALSLTEDKREREKRWAPMQEHALCAAALLWLLQQTLLLASLHAEFSDLSEKELVALWTRFHALDATLSGVIDEEDLRELLAVSECVLIEGVQCR